MATVSKTVATHRAGLQSYAYSVTYDSVTLTLSQIAIIASSSTSVGGALTITNTTNGTTATLNGAGTLPVSGFSMSALKIECTVGAPT